MIRDKKVMSFVNRLFMDKRFAFLLSKSNIYNGLVQIVTIVINLLLMPVLLDVLDKARFGVWQTMLSLIGYISLLNFGMGNGLRNTVAQYFSNGEIDAIGNLTGQTIIKLTKIILFCSLIIFPVYIILFNPNLLFKDIYLLSGEVKKSLGIFLIFFLINIISSLASSLAFGLNKSYFPGVFNIFYLLIVYIVLLLVDNINLIFVSYLFGAVQLLVNVAFFIFILRKYNIKLSYDEKYSLKETTRLSGNFFTVQILSIIFLTADNFIISNLLGVSQTAEYSIVSKIYFTIISLFSILLISFWNNVTIAFTKKDYQWIKKGLTQLFRISILILAIGLIVAIASDFIVHLWFGESNLVISKATFFLFSLFSFIHCLNAIVANFQNGIGDMKMQILSNLVIVLILISGVFLISIPRYGYNALIIIKIVAVTVGFAINLKSLKHIK